MNMIRLEEMTFVRDALTTADVVNTILDPFLKKGVDLTKQNARRILVPVPLNTQVQYIMSKVSSILNKMGFMTVLITQHEENKMLYLTIDVVTMRPDATPAKVFCVGGFIVMYEEDLMRKNNDASLKEVESKESKDCLLLSVETQEIAEKVATAANTLFKPFIENGELNTNTSSNVRAIGLMTTNELMGHLQTIAKRFGFSVKLIEAQPQWDIPRLRIEVTKVRANAQAFRVGHAGANVLFLANKAEPEAVTGGAKQPEGDNAHDRQVGGSHYQLPIQPIDYIMANGLGYCEANVVKYVSRWKSKGGVQDLKKAIHYLEMLIESVENQDDCKEPTK
jgi:bbp48